jgi:hypothetical protein
LALISNRHPRMSAIALTREVRAERASKDERPRLWPSSFETRANALLRMTGRV